MNCLKELEELITNPRKLSKLVLNHIINRFNHIINHIINRFFYLLSSSIYQPQVVIVFHFPRSAVMLIVMIIMITMIILIILITIHNHDNDHQDDLQRWVAIPPKYCDGQRKQVQPILPRRSLSSPSSSSSSASLSSLSSSSSSSSASLSSLSSPSLSLSSSSS